MSGSQRAKDKIEAIGVFLPKRFMYSGETIAAGWPPNSAACGSEQRR